jgi:N-acyl amino acid synthase of PEP-CTERM/exosortase system
MHSVSPSAHQRSAPPPAGTPPVRSLPDLSELQLISPGTGDSGLLHFKRSIADRFRNCLTVVCANSEEMLDQVFRLRYQVYCLERGFENAGEHPDGREQDGDDARSLHFLVFDRATGCAMGTVRLILPRAGDELPVLGLIGANERRRLDLPLAATAEISRFAIAKAFRRPLEAGWRHAGPAVRAGGSAEPASPLVTFGLIQAVLMMTLAGDITHIVAMMEPALLRLLRRLGIEFHPIGGLVRHHGLRQPGWAAVTHLVDRVKDCRRELWDVATDFGRRTA